MSRWLPLLPVDLLAAIGALADARAGRAVLGLLDDGAHAGRPVADRTHEHHVPDRYRGGLLDDPTGRDLRTAHAARVLQRARARVALDDVEVLHDHLALLRHRVEDAALLAAVLAGEDVHDVAFADLHRLAHLAVTFIKEPPGRARRSS